MTPLRVAALGAVVRALGSTWAMEVRGDEHRAEVSDGPFLFALWHEALLPLLWHHRHRGVALLVSHHRDGELIARVAERLGYRLIRGSSTRGGGAGFRGVLRTLDRGIPVAITPDGPRGPDRVVKPGVLRAAQLAAVPILPVTADADRVWRAESWDRLIVPPPFARIRVIYGPGLRVHRGDDTGARLDLASRLNGLADAQRIAA